MYSNSPATPPAALSASNAAPTGANFTDAPKPLIDIPNAWLWFFGIVAVLLAAALLYFAIKYWRKKRATIKLPPAIPPHVRARRALDEALGLIAEPEPFSVAVSGAIRTYLEERFTFHAPDRTTEEFLYELQSTELLTVDQKKSLGEFLASCDLIKFARYVPMEVELRALHGSALRLVNETEPRLVPDAIQSSAPASGQSPPAAAPPLMPSIAVPPVLPPAPVSAPVPAPIQEPSNKYAPPEIPLAGAKANPSASETTSAPAP